MFNQRVIPSLQAKSGADNRAAIVLAKNVTGLATLRALAGLSLDLHAIIFSRGEPISFSRYGKKVYFVGKEKDEPALLQFLIEYLDQLGGRPVVIPTSDTLALFLARYYEVLKGRCAIWENSYIDLSEIICKNLLYRNASNAKVDSVPWIESTNVDEIAEWSQRNSAPYLLKPFYEGHQKQRPFGKNKSLPSREALMAYVTENPTDSIIIQRMIKGGDGFIFDTYGYSDRMGRILTMALHRRLRQNPCNFGSTSYGEIPAQLSIEAEQTILTATERLLGHIKYHGIFGIEWLLEQSTGKFYLIDFNARPFTTIGHLTDCGMNLPALAYAELTNEMTTKLVRIPKLKRILWIDIKKDLDSLRSCEPRLVVVAKTWLLSISQCRSFAYASLRDPGPGIQSAALTIYMAARFAFKRFIHFFTSV